MNDVTVLVPLSDTPILFRATDLGGDGAPLVPQALFDELNTGGSEGLTFQPVDPMIGAVDVGLHAVYAVARDETPAALAALRALSALQGAPLDAPLTISPGLS